MYKEGHSSGRRRACTPAGRHRGDRSDVAFACRNHASTRRGLLSPIFGTDPPRIGEDRGSKWHEAEGGGRLGTVYTASRGGLQAASSPAAFSGLIVSSESDFSY